MLNACVRVADVMTFTFVSLMPVHNICRICIIIKVRGELRCRQAGVVCDQCVAGPSTKTFNIYDEYIPARGYVNTPNLVYKSLDVAARYFFYNYKFRDRDDVGACCNTLTVEQIGRIFGVNRANCQTSTNVGMGHFCSY